MLKVWITGATSGIGRALAIEYAKRSSEVPVILALVARRSSALLGLQQTLLAQYQVQSMIFSLDVRDAAALKLAATDFMQNHGVPNIVIASAGVSRGTLTEFSEDSPVFQTIMDINVMGMVNTFQPFIECMKQNIAKKNKAHLVGIASVAGVRGLPGAGAYSASKAAVINYLESLRVEMAVYNIVVTTIAPGYIRTPMTDVNEYAMPFLMDAQIAANKFIKVIDTNRRYVVIPWQMGILAKIMRIIPNIIWDRLMKNAPHKKRANGKVI